LFQILGVFYVRNIDLLKIESRPDPHAPFEYLFYVDLQGNPKEKRVAEALEHLQEKTKFYRLLGAYPMGRGKFYGAAR
jgi:prephenate dehydratase